MLAAEGLHVMVYSLLVADISPLEKAPIVIVFLIPLIVAFIIGLVIGSLSNVVIYRLGYFRSIWSPPSHCPRCRNEISWYDNIPIISWLVLRGRCRFCKGPISLKYPTIELISGLMYVGIMYRFLYAPYLPVERLEDLNRIMVNFENVGTAIFLFKAYLFTTFLLILATIDIDHQLLPNSLTVPGIVIGLALSPFMLPNYEEVFPLRVNLFELSPALDGFLQSFLGMLTGGLVIFIIFLIGYLIYKFAAMGLGDVKLAAMIGAFVGLKMIGPALFVGFVAGGLFGIILMVLKVAGMRSLIPFGPYLCIGGMVAFLWGPNLLALWLG